MINVVIADDQALVRAGFRSIVDSADDLVVVAEAADGEQAVDQVREHQPDVVLMDIRMPGLDGIEATRRIVDDPRQDQTRVIIVTTFDFDEYIFEALRAGASGFLLKDTEPGDLIESIRIIHRGDALLSPSVTRRLVSAFVTRTRDVGPIPDLARLTAREREVMALVAMGLNNDEIADRLYVSVNTAKTHVSRAMIKLGARDRAQLVVFAYQSGLVAADPTDHASR
ncbi:MAG TPA: response regulator transcription factor [Acidimicrobiia bacterium]|jgi:DNA-binding NarL/FixJ family response regulator